MTRALTRETDSETGTMAFDAVRGVQAGREFYIAMVSFKTIAEHFKFDDPHIAAEQRAQRKIRDTRVPQITNYIIQNPNNYIFSSITVSVGGKMIFQPSPGLGELGRTLLNNDLLFEFIRSFLTNPSNLDQFQRLVNAGLSAAVERGKYMPGGIQREEIRNEVVPIEIPFGEKIFEMRLDGFNIIFLEPDPIPYQALLVPIYTVKEKDGENQQCIKVGFDITSDNELVFTESIQVSEPEFGVGVAFIRPGDNDMKRTKAVWAMHKGMVSEN